MKKKIWFLALPLLLSSCSTGYNEVTYNQIETKIAQNESFVYFLGSSTCSECKKFQTQIREAQQKYNMQEPIYYVNGQKEDYDFLINTLRVEFNSALPDDFFKDSLYEEDKIYTPSIFKYYKGILVYSHIESINAKDLSYIANNNNIFIGCYENVEKLSYFENYTVYIYQTYPDIRDEQFFYFLQDSLNSVQERTLLNKINENKDEKLTELPSTLKLTYSNNVLINIE